MEDRRRRGGPRGQWTKEQVIVYANDFKRLNPQHSARAMFRDMESAFGLLIAKYRIQFFVRSQLTNVFPGITATTARRVIREHETTKMSSSAPRRLKKMPYVEEADKKAFDEAHALLEPYQVHIDQTMMRDVVC
jgi:ribosomal protein L35